MFARHTQMDTDNFASATCGGKNSIRCARLGQMLNHKRYLNTPSMIFARRASDFLPDNVVRQKYDLQQNAKAFCCSLRLSVFVCG